MNDRVGRSIPPHPLDCDIHFAIIFCICFNARFLFHKQEQITGKVLKQEILKEVLVIGENITMEVFTIKSVQCPHHFKWTQ